MICTPLQRIGARVTVLNIGLAKYQAALILGLGESYPYVREVSAPCKVSASMSE